MAAMVSLPGALRRVMQKRVNVTGLILRRAWLGWQLGTWLLKQFLSDKVDLPIWSTEHLLSFCESGILVAVAGRECYDLSSINTLVSESQTGFPNRNTAHVMMYFTAGKRSMLTPPSGREKTQEAAHEFLQTA